MENPRAAAILAATLAFAVALSGCLSGTPPTPKVAVNILSDIDLTAAPGWTVGWAVEVFQSVGPNGTVTVTNDAPAGWSAHFIKGSMLIPLVNGRSMTFLLVDIPANAANDTYHLKVHAALGGDGADAAVSVKVSRPDLNLVKNGSVVQMDYVGFLDTNQVFDTSMWAVANSSGVEKWPDFKNSSASRTQTDYHALQFTEGSHQVIKGWESSIFGMALGQGKALDIAPEDAYGHFVNQSVNITQSLPIYNQTTIAAFQPIYGAPPTEDAQFVDPTFGWTVRVVSVDNATGSCVLENMIDINHTYTPYGVNATLSNLSSASGTFDIHYTPQLNAPAKNGPDTGTVVDVNATAFTVRLQTEHAQALAPYSLYFLVFVRSVAN
jgi:hypothetical protein